MSSRRINGFTLLELMVTVAIVAIVAALAFPSFQGTLRSNRVAAFNNEVIGVMNLARSEAIRNGRGGIVCGSSSGAACDGNWAGGLLAFADADEDGELSADEAALRFVAGNPQLAVDGPDEPIGFDGRGRRRSADEQSLTLRPSECDAGAEQQRTLSINPSGQVRSTREICA